MVISTIIPNFLYLGAARDTQESNKMKELNISHIISCAGKVKDPGSYTILRGHLDDEKDQDIIPFIEEAYEFIEKARLEKGVVFVHCLAGRSRSPSVVIGYLLLSKRLPLKSLYENVKEKRECVLPNDGFMNQLIEYEFKVLGSRSMIPDEWKNGKKAKLSLPMQLDLASKRLLDSVEVSADAGIPSTSMKPTQELVDYINKILTATVVMNALESDLNILEVIKNNLRLHRDVSSLIGKIKKRVMTHLFNETDGGREYREKDNTYAWKDIVCFANHHLIHILEIDIICQSLNS